MTFAEWAGRSVSPFRVLVELDGYDGVFEGRYSLDGFTPAGSTTFYDGRLVEAPTVSIKRDDNFFGILVYSSTGIRLHNADGALDTFGQASVVEGGEFRVKVGFDDIQLSTYSTIFTGFVENCTVSEEYVDIRIGDLRKKLRQRNTVSRIQYNAVTFIQDILTEAYGITYDATYFDTTAWEIARALAPSVSRYHPDDDTVDWAIEAIVRSTMGFFFITGDGRYSYRMIDTGATSQTTIVHADILNKHSIGYDTEKILASIRSKTPDWGTWEKVADTGGGAFVDLTTHQLQGGLLRSEDDGATWETTDGLGTAATIYDLASLGSGVILAGTGPTLGRVFKSPDGGSSWSLIGQLSAQTIVSGIAYLGSGIAVAGTAGPSGKIFRSTDSGSSWSLMQTLAEEAAISVVSLGSGIVLAGAGSTSGRIYRSLDSGSSWSLIQQLGSAGSVQDLASLGSGVVLAATGATLGEIYRSTDSGSSWSAIGQLGAETNLRTLVSFGYGVVLVGGDSKAIYRSLDSGSSWSVIQQLPETTSNLDDISVMPSGIIIGQTNSKTYRAVFDKAIDPWTEDTTHAASVMSAYGIDRAKDFETTFALGGTYATDFNTAILDYFRDSHGRLPLEVPIKYYALGVGDTVDAEIKRSRTVDMLGTTKCEVMEIAWNTGRRTLSLGLRIV